FARALLHRNAPDAHTAAAIAAEVELGAIGRPDGVPIEVHIFGNARGRAAGDAHRPQVAIAVQVDGPVGDELAVGPPLRVHAVVLVDEARRAAGEIDGPDAADGAGAIFRARDAFFGIDELAPIGRPCGVVATGGDASHVRAIGAHDEDAAASAFGTERDERAIRR